MSPTFLLPVPWKEAILLIRQAAKTTTKKPKGITQMNQDTYVEWLVKRKEPAYAWPVRILMGILCLFALLTALTQIWGILLLAAVAAATFFLFQTLNIEYEYLYVDNTLSIDKILGKARRKKVIECSKEDLLMAAPHDSFVLKDYETKDIKVIDCSSGAKNAKTYAFVYKQGSQRVKLLLDPNDKLLQVVRNTAPSKIVL